MKRIGPGKTDGEKKAGARLNPGHGGAPETRKLTGMTIFPRRLLDFLCGALTGRCADVDQTRNIPASEPAMDVRVMRFQQWKAHQAMLNELEEAARRRGHIKRPVEHRSPRGPFHL
jgi:hypothetical protein